MSTGNISSANVERASDPEADFAATCDALITALASGTLTYNGIPYPPDAEGSDPALDAEGDEPPARR